MDIYYKSKHVEKLCNQQQVAITELGLEMAKKLGQRMAELKAADILADISYLPPARLHQLEGIRNGEFAVNLKQPFRLIFKPVGKSIDKTEITAITILEVINYHGKQK